MLFIVYRLLTLQKTDRISFRQNLVVFLWHMSPGFWTWVCALALVASYCSGVLQSNVWTLSYASIYQGSEPLCVQISSFPPQNVDSESAGKGWAQVWRAAGGLGTNNACWIVSLHTDICALTLWSLATFSESPTSIMMTSSRAVLHEIVRNHVHYWVTRLGFRNRLTKRCPGHCTHAELGSFHFLVRVN